MLWQVVTSPVLEPEGIGVRLHRCAAMPSHQACTGMHIHAHAVRCACATGVKYWNLRLLTNFDELHSAEPSIRVQVWVVLGYG